MPVSLDTARLVLREPVDDDAPLLLEYYRRNEARLAPWEPEHVDDVAHHLNWIAWRRGESATGHGRSFVVFDRGDPATLAGVINLYDVTGGRAHSAVLGYSVDGGYEGAGYAHEAIQAVLLYAFGTLNLHRIVANYQPHNTRSGALLARLGFAVEGYARESISVRGGWRDHVTAALINPLWKPPSD